MTKYVCLVTFTDTGIRNQRDRRQRRITQPGQPDASAKGIPMHVTFHGAVREVTGSAHLLENDGDRILMDCGLVQGRRKETNAKNRNLPFDAARLTNVVLSHAHIDHSERVHCLQKARQGVKRGSIGVTVAARTQLG